MRGEVKNLFERYCDSKNASPKSIQEIEPLLQEFLGVLNQDLQRAFFLKGFARIQANIPNLIEPFHNLIKSLSSLEDPRLQELCQQKEDISSQRMALLQEYLEPYQLCRNEQLLAFQDNPSQEQLLQFIQEFQTQPWLEKLENFNTETKKVYDTPYHQMAKSFLSDVENFQAQVKSNTLKQSGLPAVSNQLLPALYRLTRRGEIGIEMTELALSGRLSFLGYAEMMNKSDEAFAQMLPGILVTSQWDWLHDNKLLHKSLFLTIRKQGTFEITKELNDRIELVKTLSKLIKNQWVDSRQAETILKNSFVQPATKSLDSLQIFTIKKEIGPFVQKKAKGSPDETIIMDQLSTLMKSNDALKAFYQELLGSAESLSAREKEVSLEAIKKLLDQAIKKKTLATEQSTQANAFQKMRDKVIDPAQDAKAAKEPESSDPPPDAILQEIDKVQKKLLQSINVMDELMSTHYPKGTAIGFLEKHAILLPEAEQFFRRKLQILKQHVKQGKAGKGAAQMLAKLKNDIQSNLKIDTQFLILKETLKTYEGHWELTPEESAHITNMEVPAQERGVFIDLCRQKYSFLQELQSFVPDQERLESLHLESASALLISILQDILQEQPFYFSKEELEAFKNFVPPTQESQIKLCRKHSFELYKHAIGNALFNKLVRWGFWKMPGAEQAQLIETITRSFQMEASDSNKWSYFKSLHVSKQSLEKISRSIPPKVEEIIDGKGKTILSNMRTALFKNDEAGMKNILKKDIEYLANSLTTTDYIAKIQALLDSFTKVELSSHRQKNSANQKLPTSQVTQQFNDILNMEFYDQRLELLMDELQEILPPDSAVMETGKQLYKDFTGFDY